MKKNKNTKKNKIKVSPELVRLIVGGTLVTLSATVLGAGIKAHAMIEKERKEIIEEYEEIFNGYKDLDNSYNEMHNDNVEIIEGYEEIINGYKELSEGYKELTNSYKELGKKIRESRLTKDSIEYNTRKEDIVFITNTTYVYGEENTDSDIYGKLLEGRNYRYLGETEEWYNIDYFGFHGYVPKTDGIKIFKYVMKYPAISKGYLVDEEVIYADKEMTYELDTLPELEFVEIHRELNDSYLVSTTDDKIGYINKENVRTIEENSGVVDRSDEVMYVYDGNVCVMSMPVVTGCIKNNTESDLGFYNIFMERGRCSFSGVTVNHMLNYNGGEGIHDAHRWRQIKEFGGDTYISNGSHGCINNLEWASDYAAFILDEGDKVLVKE